LIQGIKRLELQLDDEKNKSRELETKVQIMTQKQRDTSSLQLSQHQSGAEFGNAVRQRELVSKLEEANSAIARLKQMAVDVSQRATAAEARCRAETERRAALEEEKLAREREVVKLREAISRHRVGAGAEQLKVQQQQQQQQQQHEGGMVVNQRVADAEAKATAAQAELQNQHYETRQAVVRMKEAQRAAAGLAASKVKLLREARDQVMY
jgi:hypothetical protein